MRSLIAKEWRESRALILGFLVLAPVASLLIKGLLVGFRHTEAADSLAFIIPGAFALFVFALSADLAAGDISSGRIAFFAALPISPGKVWAAKSVFLAGAGILYLGYVLLVEVVILSLAGKSFAPLLGAPAAGMALPLAAIVTAGAATFLFSTLIDRGFAAALAGFGLVAGSWIALDAISKGTLPKLTAACLPACVVLTTASLAGSAAVFLAGRVHLRAKLRRVIVAGLAFLLVLVPATVWAGVSVRNWLSIDAADGGLALGGGRPTPDGQWALVAASRRGEGPFGLPTIHEDWAVNIETGVVREFDRTGWVMGGDRDFSEGPGRLVLFRPDSAPGGKVLWLRVVYDLNEGRVISTRSVSREGIDGRPNIPWGHHRMDLGGKTRRLHAADGRTCDGPEGWTFLSATSTWGVALYRWSSKVEHRRYAVLTLESGAIREIPHLPHLLPDDPDGIALCISQPIRRIPLAGGEPEEIDLGRINSYLTSPDRSYAIVSSEQGLYLLRASDASVTRIEDGTPHGRSPCIIWAPDSKTFLVHGYGPNIRGTVTEAGATVEQVQVSPLITFPVHFDGSRLLGFGQDQGAYFSSDLDGKSRQLLPVR